MRAALFIHRTYPLHRHFKPQAGFRASYSIAIEEKKKKLIITVDGQKLECYYGNVEQADVEMQLPRAAFHSRHPIHIATVAPSPVA